MGERGVLCTVVVPVRNAVGTLPACLQALNEQTVGPLDVIVVDDDSDDGSAIVARENGAMVITQPHAGPARARNKGAHAAQSSIILFTDSDCVPRSDWVEKMLRSLRQAGVSGCRGAYVSSQRSLIARFVQLDYEDRYRRTERLSDLDFVDTYSAGYLRTVLLGMGGFDEDFQDSCVEDHELSFRLANAGHRMVFARNARVEHQHPATLKSYVGKKFKIGFYKPRVLARHTNRIVTDSHTPPILKLQTLAAMAALPLSLVAPTSVGSRRLCRNLLLGVALTSVPLAFRNSRKDLPVGLLTPALALVRGVALAGGMWTGSLRLIWLRCRGGVSSIRS